MKNLFIIFVLIIVFISCRRNGSDTEALVICNCYDQIHNESVMSNNNKELEQKVNVCNEMLKDKLGSFGVDAERRKKFMESVRACQES